VKQLLRLVGLATLVTLSGCASTFDLDGAVAIVPYQFDKNGRIVVPAHIDDQGPFDFVLDTGSSISAVVDAVSRELGLEAVPGSSVRIHGMLAAGQFSLLNVGQLEIGREIRANPRIVSLPGDTDATDGIDGVLGADFLRNYAVMFSVRDRIVRLYPPDLVAAASYRGWTSIPLEAAPIGTDGPVLYFIDIEINGRPLRAVFDLGAGFNMTNWEAARTLGLTPQRFRDDDQMSGALDSTPVVARFVSPEVTTKNIRWREEVFTVGDLEIFETFAQRDRPAAILGAGLFTQRDFIIDFVGSRLLINVAMEETNSLIP
jgi:predicted aspartyl protease